MHLRVKHYDDLWNTLIYALCTNHEVIAGENFNSLCYCGVSRKISPIISSLNVITH